MVSKKNTSTKTAATAFDRPWQRMTINEKIAETALQLRLGMKLYDEGTPNGRLATRFALSHALTFLESLPELRELLRPLVRLGDALGDLEKGTVQPLLQPANRSKKGGRTQLGSSAIRLQAYSISAVEELHSLGIPLNTSCAQVSTTLRKHELQPSRGKGSISGRTVRGWRETALAEPDSELAMYVSYIRYLHQEEGVRASRPNSAAEILRLFDLIVSTYKGGALG